MNSDFIHGKRDEKYKKKQIIPMPDSRTHSLNGCMAIGAP